MAQLSPFCKKGHEKPNPGWCEICKVEWIENYKAKRVDAVKRYRKTEKGKATDKRYLKRKAAKLRKNTRIRKKKTMEIAPWVKQARDTLRLFLSCWEVSTTGATLPRESLPKLQEVRAKAQYLLLLRVAKVNALIEKGIV